MSIENLEDKVPTFSDTVIDLKKALEAEDVEMTAIRKALRNIEAIVEVRDCSSWPATYVTVSRKWERWSGLHEHDVVGKTDYDYRPRKMADAFTLVLKEVVSAHRTLTYVSNTGNEASNFCSVRFTLTPYLVGKKDFVVAIGLPIVNAGRGA
jgi:hypothetical protein